MAAYYNYIFAVCNVVFVLVLYPTITFIFSAIRRREEDFREGFVGSRRAIITIQWLSRGSKFLWWYIIQRVARVTSSYQYRN